MSLRHTESGASDASRQPTFVGIGAQKSATTWCWTALDEHPDVFMSQPKELEFFTRNYHRGRDWYEAHFARAAAPIRGEISPLYIDDPLAADRIQECYPDAALLVVLREPRARAMSNLLFYLRDSTGRATDASVDKLREMAASDTCYLRRSCYADALAPYFERFASNQLHVLFYEDLRRNPAEFVSGLYQAVGADPTFRPSTLETPSNKTNDFWSPALFRSLQIASQLSNAWAPTRRVMEWVYHNTRFRERTLSWLQRETRSANVSFEEVFGQRAAALLDEQVARLREELGVSPPPEWLRPLSQAAA
jgi:hypothetical protein